MAKRMLVDAQAHLDRYADAWSEARDQIEKLRILTLVAAMEAAIASLGLFDVSKLPKISHGLCQECFTFGMAEVDRL